MIAGAIIVKKMVEKARDASENLFQGEITVSKKDCWLAGAVLLLAGVILGFIYAPLTHGVRFSLFSHNGNESGNNNGNNNGNYDKDETENEEVELC